MAGPATALPSEPAAQALDRGLVQRSQGAGHGCGGGARRDQPPTMPRPASVRSCRPAPVRGKAPRSAQVTPDRRRLQRAQVTTRRAGSKKKTR